MQAKLIEVLDINEPEKQFFGVRITGLRRPIFGSDDNGIIARTDKKEVKDLVKQFNEKFEANPSFENKLREDKTIQAVKI